MKKTNVIFAKAAKSPNSFQVLQLLHLRQTALMPTFADLNPNINVRADAVIKGSVEFEEWRVKLTAENRIKSNFFLKTILK